MFQFVQARLGAVAVRAQVRINQRQQKTLLKITPAR
jgi:hypothetical protein